MKTIFRNSENIYKEILDFTFDIVHTIDMLNSRSTLLNKAKRDLSAGRKVRAITDEHADLIVALYNDEISIMQFANAISANRGNAYCIAMTMLRTCVASGMVKVVKA